MPNPRSHLPDLGDQSHPSQNRLLAALPELESLIPHLELIPMALGDSLWKADRPLPAYAYFPTSAIISLHHILENGSSSASASVGREGMLGLPLLMGSEIAPSWAIVHNAGFGYRLKAALLLQKFNEGGLLRRLLLRYNQALVTEVSQNVVCTRHHKIEQQLCRWLLSTLDRLGSQELVVTQELISSILGVRREGVTEIARKLQEAGTISYRRGHVTVIDRAGLERRACYCHDIIRKEFDQVLDDARTYEEKHEKSSIVPEGRFLGMS
jgi:CRP-like cAMP-binding protein